MRLGIFKRKWIREHEQSRFDLLDLDQFRSTACRYLTGYVFMYISLIISLAVYASDIYTAIVLLAFDRWSTSIKPYVPFRISRWIFGGCIILSFILLIYEYVVAYTIIKGKNVSLTYTNPVARNLYSIYGYKYFCLFAKITKSKNKVEYIALFVFFTFKGWLRLIFADSPRQVLNALTLYSVLKIDSDFVDTVKDLATKSFTEAAVVSVMAFSLFIWVINVSQFIIALLCACPLYVHIDKSECTGLEEYCCTRINKRIAKLVAKHHKKGLKDLKEANKRLPKQPTLPLVDMNSKYYKDDGDDDDEDDYGQTTESFDDIVPLNKKGGLAKSESKDHLLSNSSSQTTLAHKDSSSSLNSSNTMTNTNPLNSAYTNEYGGSSQTSLLTHQNSNPSMNSYRQPPPPPNRNNNYYQPKPSPIPEVRSPASPYHPPTRRFPQVPPVDTSERTISNNSYNNVKKSPSQQVQVQEPSPDAAVAPSSVTFGNSTESTPRPPPPITNPNRPPPGRGGSRPVPPPIRTDLAQARQAPRQQPPAMAKPIPYRPSPVQQQYPMPPPPPTTSPPYSAGSSVYSPEAHNFGATANNYYDQQRNVSPHNREPTLPNLRDSSVSMSTTQSYSRGPSPAYNWAPSSNHMPSNRDDNNYTQQKREPTLPKFDDMDLI